MSEYVIHLVYSLILISLLLGFALFTKKRTFFLGASFSFIITSFIFDAILLSYIRPHYFTIGNDLEISGKFFVVYLGLIPLYISFAFCLFYFWDDGFRKKISKEMDLLPIKFNPKTRIPIALLFLFQACIAISLIMELFDFFWSFFFFGGFYSGLPEPLLQLNYGASLGSSLPLEMYFVVAYGFFRYCFFLYFFMGYFTGKEIFTQTKGTSIEENASTEEQAPTKRTIFTKIIAFSSIIMIIIESLVPDVRRFPSIFFININIFFQLQIVMYVMTMKKTDFEILTALYMFPFAFVVLFFTQNLEILTDYPYLSRFLPYLFLAGVLPNIRYNETAMDIIRKYLNRFKSLFYRGKKSREN